MPIPTYDKFIEPILRYLANHPEGERASVVYEAAAEALGINEDDKLMVLPSRTQPVYKNRAGWAHDRLKRAGLSSAPRYGIGSLLRRVWFLPKRIRTPSANSRSKN